MKTAISLPDPLFRDAERLAKKLGVSRSELYARALDALVRAHDAAAITEALNRVYADEPATMDDALARAQTRALARDPW